MSRQNKQAKRYKAAAAVTALHGPVQDSHGQITMTGRRGPSRTSPRTEGRHGMRANPKRVAALAEVVKTMRLEGRLR